MSETVRYRRLIEAFQYVDDVFLDIVEEEKSKTKRKPTWRYIGTVAACILVLIIPVGALAARLFGLWDLLLQREENDTSNFSVSDFFASTEVYALRQWEEFLEGYDIDGAILSEAMETGFALEGREDWMIYGVYSYEMGEKLDAIADRFGLVLNHTVENINFEELQNRVGGNFIIDADIEDPCQYYEHGSFYLKGSAELTDGRRAAFAFQCVVKGTFDNTLPRWGDYNNMDEWRYRTVCGESVCLALGASHAMILTDVGDRYCLAVVPQGRDMGITEESLQELADKIDFGMVKKMKLPENSGNTPIPTVSTISLHGYRNSPESKALLEWEEFLTQYDADRKIFKALGNNIFSVEGREDWSLYHSVYSYEMGEKMDEIAERYGLKLHTDVNYVDHDELMYRVGGDFLDEGSLSWAYVYEDGYFQAEGEMELAGCGTANFQFTRSVRGTFNDVSLNIQHIEDYTDWQYLTASGEPVLLALGSYKALIFGDFEGCFISVNVLNGSVDGMTKEDLQEMADQIDFRILKEVQVPDMRGDTI